MIILTIMTHQDRLSALINRFSITVTPTAPDQSNFLVLKNRETDELTRALFSPTGGKDLVQAENETTAFCAKAEWGGNSNPLLQTLAAHIELKFESVPDVAELAQILISESREPRCGSRAVVNRLGEILLVRMLRQQLNQGMTTPGLLGGLADQRLSRAIVAMHEHPGKAWTNEILADLAGLSVSRFYQLFRLLVGMPPMVYLRNWRMGLVRQDIERGEQIQRIARRYGYRSSEALTRAFSKAYGIKPTEHRKRTLRFSN